MEPSKQCNFESMYRRVIVAAILTATLIHAGCGSDDDDDASESQDSPTAGSPSPEPSSEPSLQPSQTPATTSTPDSSPEPSPTLSPLPSPDPTLTPEPTLQPSLTPEPTPDPLPNVVPGDTYALLDNLELVSFDLGSPGVIRSSAAITGLQEGEELIGLDFRPATGELFSVGTSSRIYVLDPTTGQATAIGSSSFTPALSGTEFGLDFNPTVDRIRLVSNDGQNLRLHPTTGAVAGTDTTLAYATGDVNFGADPELVGAAYANNFLGATTTTLYGIDSGLNVLVTQGSINASPTSPNSGQLFTVGSLSIDVEEVVGFDIGPENQGIALMREVGKEWASLYSVNLTTGAVTSLGTFGVEGSVMGFATTPSPAPDLYAITASNRLVSFNAAFPGTTLSSMPITGLTNGESIVGIDFRPATGSLLGLSSSSRLYTLDITSGIATAIGSSSFSPALDGTSFGFDFNPTVDRVRLVSNSGQNLRLHPTTGAVVGTDPALTFAAEDANANVIPTVVGSAYANNFLGSTTTTLYGIDAGLDILVTQGSVNASPTSPNTGILYTVGALGISVSEVLGLDIGDNNAAFAAMAASGQTATLYTINLASGAATSLGTIGASDQIQALAVKTSGPPTLYVISDAGQLVKLNAGSPGVPLSSVAISGLADGESILALDWRPATGDLYALGSSSRLYLLNGDDGVATAVASDTLNPALSGSSFGMDFNPTVDRIRVVSNTGQNLRLHPSTGIVAGTDTTLSYSSGDTNAAATPFVVGSAYTNNFVGASSTTLYGIDAALNILVTQGSVNSSPTSPNTGQLFTVGALTVDPWDVLSFDIGHNNEALAAITLAGQSTSSLYYINLSTGAASIISSIGTPDAVRAMTILR